MREADDFTERLRRWYDRPFAADFDRCQEAPLFGDLVEFARSHRPQTEADQVHISTCPRCRRTLAAIEEGSRRPLAVLEGRTRWRRRWPVAATLATAATLCFAVLIVRARAFDLREIGYAKPILVQGPSVDLTNSAVVAEVSARVAQLRAERDEALNAGANPWLPWTQLYRNLSALGRWEEALRETHAFVEYARQQDRKPERYSMYYTALFDLGETYAAIGDNAAALEYHQESLAAARDYHEWLHRTGHVPDATPLGYAREAANTLVPRHWALSSLAAAEGDQKAAWRYHQEANDLLTDYFSKECRHRGFDAPPDAPLHELATLVVAGGDKGVEALTVKVREHLLHRAMLLRLDRKLDAATRALDIGATLPDHPFADESRLDFHERMERLRIAIARGNFAAALTYADEAETHTGPRHFDGRPTHPPITIIAGADLQFLKGVALAGLHRADPQAIRLIDAAFEAVEQTAASLSPTERERFLRPFEEWNSFN